MPKQKHTQPCPKTLYRVKNWSEYEKALVQRGSITIWLSDGFEESWQYAGEKQRGSQFDYSDQAIAIMLTVKNVFHFPNRATEGFVRSIFAVLKVMLAVPDHTTLARRGNDLKVILPRKVKGHLNIVMDSTGMKVYEGGEWKVRIHGKSKQRTWRKLHVGVDPEGGEIQAAAPTENSVSDDSMVEPLLEQINQPADCFAGDGWYDKHKMYDSLNKHAPGAEVLIPPRKNACIWQHGNTKAERLKRDENLCYIRIHGRRDWKQVSSYDMHPLAETTMFRSISKPSSETVFLHAG